MKETYTYRLNKGQKIEIKKLLKIKKDEEAIFDRLENLMNNCSGLSFHSNGQIASYKKADVIARDFDRVSQTLMKLEKTLRNINPSILGHLNDRFNLFYLDASEAKNSQVTSRRSIIPFLGLISKMRDWTSSVGKDIKSQDGGSYFLMFLDEVADFWFWTISPTARLPNASFRKLIIILTSTDYERVKKQVERWVARRKGDKTKK